MSFNFADVHGAMNPGVSLAKLYEPLLGSFYIAHDPLWFIASHSPDRVSSATHNHECAQRSSNITQSIVLVNPTTLLYEPVCEKTNNLGSDQVSQIGLYSNNNRLET